MIVSKDGAIYTLPIYGVNENGLTLKGQQIINFVKGSKDDKSIYRQDGIISEDLVKVLLHYIQTVNVGDLKSVYGDEQEFHLKKILESIENRKNKRISEGTFQTYKK